MRFPHSILLLLAKKLITPSERTSLRIRTLITLAMSAGAAEARRTIRKLFYHPKIFAASAAGKSRAESRP